MPTGNPKIDLKQFMKLAYEKRLSNIEIAKYFGVGVSALGSFRMRNKLPPRGWSIHPFLGKKHSVAARKKMSNSLKGKKAWNKFLPDFWNCGQCGKQFRNRDGQRRKYCSHKCYWSFKKGKTVPGGFLGGEKHWNYNPDRSKIINRYISHTVFTHKEKTEILKRCNYSCQMCGKKFKQVRVYKLIKSGIRYDHVKPIRLGGEHCCENGQILCTPCETIKTRKDKLEILHGHPYV